MLLTAQPNREGADCTDLRRVPVQKATCQPCSWGCLPLLQLLAP